MRFHAKSALIFLSLYLAASPAGLAQEKRNLSNGAYRAIREYPDLQQKAIGSRPLTPGEGLAVLSAALDSRHHAAFSSDCSHFVHGLYERAGFPYGYANSSELYAGIDEFRRVA